MPDRNGGGFVPNGQPPQFTRPPVYPEKAARPTSAQPLPAGYQIPTNGTPYSHPSRWPTAYPDNVKYDTLRLTGGFCLFDMVQC